jgi:ribose transport system substrate-binding protein
MVASLKYPHSENLGHSCLLPFKSRMKVISMKKLLSIVTLSIAALFLGSGCEKKAAPEPSHEAIAPSSNANSHVIEVIPKLTNTVFWQSVLAGAKEAGKDFGCEIIWAGPDRETNSARQIQIVDDAIARQVAGVVIAPVDRIELVPTVDKLAGLKIPCALIDSGIETIQFLSFASTDNFEGGVLAARRMGQILGGKGNVLVVRHLAGSHATIKRVSGFTETLANEFPDIKIVDSQSGQDTAETAKKETLEMLQRNSDVQGLFACNVDVSVGALQALQEAKRTEVKMVAFDPDRTLLDGLPTGQVDSIVLQNPYKMGYEGVKAVALHLKGQTVPRIIDTGVEMVTDKTLTEPKILRLLGNQE